MMQSTRVRYSPQYLRAVGAAAIEGIHNARGTVRFVNTFKNCAATVIVRWDDGHVSTVPVTDLLSEDSVQLEAA